MLLERKVAVKRKNGKFTWDNLADVNALKKMFYKKPERYIEKDSILYVLEVNKKRLHTSFTAALKISGTVYALVLMMTDGKYSGKDYNRHMGNLKQKNFKRNGEEYIKHFEKIIKNYGIYVGRQLEEGVEWYKEGDYPIKLTRIQNFYRTQSELFYVIDNNIYFLRCFEKNIIDLFYRCVELAGSERALAKAIADDARTEQQHIMNFKRLGFKQYKTFNFYVKKFSEYSRKNQPLFEDNNYE